MSKQHTKRVVRASGNGMFLRGVLLGMSGPGAFFQHGKRAIKVKAEPASVSDSWNSVGQYIDRATDNERLNVEKAHAGTRKDREFAR